MIYTRHKSTLQILQHVSEILILKLCVVSHSGLLTLLPIRLAIFIVPVPVDRKHVHCCFGLARDSKACGMSNTYAEEINDTRALLRSRLANRW